MPTTRVIGWTRSLRRPALITALAALLASCAPGLDRPLLPQYREAGDYQLGPGDQLRVIVFGEDQLSKEFTVGDEGKLSFPLVGSIDAAGKTPEEVATALTAALQNDNFIRHPNVSVQIAAYRPIFVVGEVNKPGKYPYQPGMTMLTAITVAGGFTYRAFEDYAFDIRHEGHRIIQGRINPGSFIAPGDVIKVYERHF